MTAKPLPGLAISEGGVRFERARAILDQVGFRVVQMPAVFVPSTPSCLGTNGHRLAMRNAWTLIAMANVSMGLFEDDVRCSTSRASRMIALTRRSLLVQVSLPTTSTPSRLSVDIRAYLNAHMTADVAYLGHLQGHYGKFANHGACGS